MKRNTLILIIIFAVLVIIAAVVAFVITRPGAPTQSGQESTIISEGTTPPNPSYFTTPEGKIIYNGDPSGKNEAHDIKFPPVMAGAQRIYPADEDPKIRESYLTHESLDAVLEFYKNYLDVRKTDYASQNTLADNFAVVQEVQVRGTDGRRQAAVYVNKDEGPRGGLKVILKEFPEQKAVEIILTTVEATPPGINPTGTYVSPEEVEKWAKEEAAKKAEEERKRKEAQDKATDQGTASDASGN